MYYMSNKIIIIKNTPHSKLSITNIKYKLATFTKLYDIKSIQESIKL